MKYEKKQYVLQNFRINTFKKKERENFSYAYALTIYILHLSYEAKDNSPSHSAAQACQKVGHLYSMK